MRMTDALSAPGLAQRSAYPTLTYRLSVIGACLLAAVMVHFAFADYDQVLHGPPASAVLMFDLLSAPTMLVAA
jgi:hypothetical protein